MCAVFPPLSLINVTVHTQNLKLYFEARDAHSGYSDVLWAGWREFDTRQAQEIFPQPHSIQTYSETNPTFQRITWVPFPTIKVAEL